MIMSYIYMMLYGYLEISVEGFFVERFINICKSQKILLKDLHIESNSYIKIKILKSDFKLVKNIAKKTKCKVEIERKKGIPFILNKYRKRKIFAIAILVIALIIFGVTRFIWNVDVVGNEKISKEDIINLAKDYGIDKGKLKSKIDIEKISNLIRLKRDDISWIGISISGTNAVITIQESTQKPEIIDKNEVCNIISESDAIISKIVVQSGTARVKEGDHVKQGDLLVEGIMEGTYAESRKVHAEANIYGKIVKEIEKSGEFVQDIKTKTGNIEEIHELCINKFKIFFKKALPYFENYDKICTSKKVKLFSNYYLPIEIRKISFVEYEYIKKEYTIDELKEKLISEIEDEAEIKFNISNYESKDIKRDIAVNEQGNSLMVKIVYEFYENIGKKVK